MIGTPGFVGARLAQARMAHGMTAVTLANLLEVRTSNITLYEQGKQSPSPEVMERLLGTLHMSLDFFLRPVPPLDADRIFYRSISSATKSARSRAEVRFSWLKEVVAYLRRYLDFPVVNIPAFTPPENPEQISTSLIEDVANECRRFYKLGDGPLPDLVGLLENNGVIVSRGELDAETLDAFSQFPSDEDRPYIFLGSDKGSAVRSRFDCAHELGHLLLHRGVDPSANKSVRIHSLMERQGHRFASAFLLSESGFTRELYAASLDGFLALKPRWRVAVAAMVMRTEDLGIVTETQARRLWINMSRRKWRKNEPLDDRLLPEQPRLLRRSIEILIESGVKSPSQIAEDLCLSIPDIESLTNLPDGTLSVNKQAEPRLKPAPPSPGVIAFRPKRN